MDTEQKTVTTEKTFQPTHDILQMPEREFVKLLEASVRIQDITMPLPKRYVQVKINLP